LPILPNHPLPQSSEQDPYRMILATTARPMQAGKMKRPQRLDTIYGPD